MTTTGQTWVADWYDAYVTTTSDIPFFVEIARQSTGPVLELMAGTGRVSVPLVEAGVDLTCVDLSAPMLAHLAEKLAARGLSAQLEVQDIRVLDLSGRRFDLALLPFQAFGELVSPADQRQALERVHTHLLPGGRFICTLHNPLIRRRGIDGALHLRGTVELPNQQSTLMLWSHEQEEPNTGAVRAIQLYEVYDHEGRMVEKRYLDVRFCLLERAEFARLAEEAGFRVQALYGAYDGTAFTEQTSPYMIWVLARCAALAAVTIRGRATRRVWRTARRTADS